VAHFLAKELQLIAIVAGSSSNIFPTNSDTGKVVHLNENDVQAHHDQNRFAHEHEYFGSYSTFRDVPIHCPHDRQLNTPETLSFLLKDQPDLVLRFGSSIVRPVILNAFPSRVLNLHLGLAPHYRGSATNLVPLADWLPKRVGATVHQAGLKLDAGHVVHQLRLKFNALHSPDAIGNSTLETAGKIYAEVAKRYRAGVLATILKVTNVGKLTTMREILAEWLRRTYRNFENDMIASLLEPYNQRVAMYPIVQAI
jgi:folate-dependent phosphoribosylglycinamide formyltransferase PurN